MFSSGISTFFFLFAAASWQRRCSDYCREALSQAHMESKMGFRLFPSSVREYSTLGGSGPQTASLHGPQLGRQDLLGYVSHGLLQLSKSFGSGHQVPENEDLPFVPNEAQCGFHRAGREFCPYLCIFHISSPPKYVFVSFPQGPVAACRPQVHWHTRFVQQKRSTVQPSK